MNPNGKLYRINEPLFVFPSIAAALLKYKKHEWIVIAFEKEKKISSAWLNKGFDRSGVSPYLSVQDIADAEIKTADCVVFITINPTPMQIIAIMKRH